MDLLPAILLLIMGSGLLILGFIFNREEEASPSLSNMAALRKEISALRDEVRRNDAKNDLVQREILLVRSAMPDLNESPPKTILSSEDNVKGLFEPRFGDAAMSRAERNKEIVAMAQQGYSSSDIAEELAMSNDTVSMIINKFKRA
ncbi:MAG: hypothetical protein FWG40_02220 [Peptococcaceae bacterium]|nr:hypothetical protein [Peptococcaceae bacterium]